MAATALLAAAEAFVPITRAPSTARLLVQRASYSGSAKRTAPMMARKPFIAGNWKLNPATLDEATSLAKAVSHLGRTDGRTDGRGGGGIFGAR